MTKHPDDWDQDEREALAGFADQLETIRRRHSGNPSIEMLRAARAEALPDELQASVSTHLSQNAWSRALVEGLEDGGDEPALDRVSEERLWARIRKQLAPAAAPAPRWKPWAYGGLALAASAIIAVSTTREADPPATPPTAGAPTTIAAPPDAPPAGTPAVTIAFDKPDIKLTAAALTWRGAPAENPFLLNLKPAVDAYRDGNYAEADTRFTALAAQYPGSVEVRFYQGLTRMLRDDFAGAVAPLTEAYGLKDPTFVNDATWYLAVAEQRSGRTAEARARFDALCTGSSAFADRACEAARQMQAQEGSPRP